MFKMYVTKKRKRPLLLRVSCCGFRVSGSFRVYKHPTWDKPRNTKLGIRNQPKEARSICWLLLVTPDGAWEGLMGMEEAPGV